MYYGKGIRRQKAGAGKDPPDAESLQQTAFPDKGRHFIFPAGSAVWELYGLEGETGALPAEKEKPIAGSFRIRFVIAMALLLFFILCDLNHLSYGGETTDSIYGRMIKSPDFSRLLEFDKEDN